MPGLFVQDRATNSDRALLRRPLQTLPQFKSLQFPSRSFRQLGNKLHPPRPLVPTNTRPNPFPQFRHQPIPIRKPRLQNHKSRNLSRSTLILPRHNSSLQNRRMSNQSTLNFRRTKPPPIHFKSIVRPPRIPKIIIRILMIFIPSPKPPILKRRPSPLLLPPITSTNRIPLNHQIPNLALLNQIPALIHNLRLIPRNNLPAGTRPHIPRRIRNHHLQSLGRSQRIQNLHPKSLFESLIQRRRQRFPSRNRLPHTRKIKLPPILCTMRQKRRIIRRHRKK